MDARAQKPVSRQLSGFHTAPALEALFAFDPKAAHDWLLDTPPDTIAQLRDYQRQYSLDTEGAIIAGRRELLVAMATGTGKTLLTVAQIYRLLESKLARRILFLVDRKVLAAQAVREFNAFTTPRNRKFTQESAVQMMSPSGKIAWPARGPSRVWTTEVPAGSTKQPSAPLHRQHARPHRNRRPIWQRFRSCQSTSLCLSSSESHRSRSAFRLGLFALNLTGLTHQRSACATTARRRCLRPHLRRGA